MIKEKSSRKSCQALCMAVVVTLFLALCTSVEAQTITKDKVAMREGTLTGAASYTSNGGGRRGTTGDYALNLDTAGGYVNVASASFLNAATTNDEMSMAFWVKKYDIANSSAFWTASPSQARVFQAHTPWSDNVVYFDTSGCCAAGTQRTSANINTLPGFTGDTSDISWWTNTWRHFVFSKKAGVKQIWIDGVLFLESDGTAMPLATDVSLFTIGSETSGANRMHGLVDDFTVWRTALTETQVTNLFGGALPSALPASAGLLAWWDFNDYPPEGVFVSITPAPNVTDASPDLIEVRHRDGNAPWTSNNVSLKVDGLAVASTFTKVGDVATVRYVPNPLFAAQSSHSAELTYPDAAGAPKTLTWSFDVGVFTRDVVASRFGYFRGDALFSASGGGRTGTPGDYADRQPNGYVSVSSPSFLNEALTNDVLAVSYWQKRFGVADSCAFWIAGPTQDRIFQAHVPWGDSVIYFDTGGIGSAGTPSACCNAETRISANIDTFGGYTGDSSWWTTNWHHFVFQKNHTTKQVWIDGQVFLEGEGLATMVAANLFNIGADNGGGSRMAALIDDFAVFTNALTELQISNLFKGTLPTALPAGTGLRAYWNFNDIPAGGLFSGITPARNATNAEASLISITHQDGATPWDTNKVVLRVDGSPVAATVTKVGDSVTAKYSPNPLFANGSMHTVALVYDGNVVYTWSFSAGNPGRFVYFVTADPGPLTFAGDIAVYQRLLARGFSVELARGSDVPNDGSTALRKNLIIQSSSLGSGTVENADPAGGPAIGKFKFLAIPVIEWEASSEDAFGFQDANGTATAADQTQINIVDATSPLAAGFPNGLITVVSAVQPFSQGTPTGAHIVATAASDPSQAVIYSYEKGDKGFNDFVMPARRVFYYFGDNTASVLTADGLKLFDAAVDWAINIVAGPTLTIARGAGAALTITYTGTLQSATTLGGPWSNVAGATSPFPVTPPSTAGAVFYRSSQ